MTMCTYSFLFLMKELGRKILQGRIHTGSGVHSHSCLGCQSSCSCCHHQGPQKLFLSFSQPYSGLDSIHICSQGTELYDSKYGTFVDLGMLDVMQIFGRAGRPQYDKMGHGVIITSHEKLSHYLSLLTCQCPIESSFLQSLVDNLNAEVSYCTIIGLFFFIHGEIFL